MNPFPSDPRTPVTDSPELTPVISATLIITPFNAGTPTANEQSFRIDVGGPHGLFEFDLDNIGNPDFLTTGLSLFLPSIGTFIYIFAATNSSGGFVAVDFAINDFNILPNWWEVARFGLTAGVPLPIPAIEIPTPYAKVRFGNTSGGQINVQASVITRTR